MRLHGRIAVRPGCLLKMMMTGRKDRLSWRKANKRKGRVQKDFLIFQETKPQPGDTMGPVRVFPQVSGSWSMSPGRPLTGFSSALMVLFSFPAPS